MARRGYQRAKIVGLVPNHYTEGRVCIEGKTEEKYKNSVPLESLSPFGIQEVT